MAKFKSGDMVKRTAGGPHVDVVVGGVYEVSHTHVNGDLSLQRCEGLYSDKYFTLVEGTVPTTRKDDSGKLDMTLLDDMPRAVAAVVEVMQWAITKKAPTPYIRGSWQGVHPDRYRAAILRHHFAGCDQSTGLGQLSHTHVNTQDAARFQRDKETELLHLAHIACSALMALESTLRELEKST